VALRNQLLTERLLWLFKPSTCRQPQPLSLSAQILAKKCREMAIEAHPPARAGTKPYAQAERDFFREWSRVMRMVAVYLAKATEFDALAHRSDEPSLRQRFMDMADSYRLLAEERRRHIDDKKMDRKVPPQSD
jgi:hypothetical protein